MEIISSFFYYIYRMLLNGMLIKTFYQFCCTFLTASLLLLNNTDNVIFKMGQNTKLSLLKKEKKNPLSFSRIHPMPSGGRRTDTDLLILMRKVLLCEEQQLMLSKITINNNKVRNSTETVKHPIDLGVTKEIH